MSVTESVIMNYRIVRIKGVNTGIPPEELRKGFGYFLENLEVSRETVVRAASHADIIQIWQWMFMDRGYVTDTEIVGYCLEQYLEGFGIWDTEDYSEPRLS